MPYPNGGARLTSQSEPRVANGHANAQKVPRADEFPALGMGGRNSLNPATSGGWEGKTAAQVLSTPAPAPAPSATTTKAPSATGEASSKTLPEDAVSVHSDRVSLL